jgi:hypothetical protein
MKYLYALIIFLILIALIYSYFNKLNLTKKKRIWLNIIALDLMFALLSLVYFYMIGFKWYSFIIFPTINLVIIYFSGKYLLNLTVFKRRESKE